MRLWLGPTEFAQATNQGASSPAVLFVCLRLSREIMEYVCTLVTSQLGFKVSSILQMGTLRLAAVKVCRG